ncbi:unnamed protein product [Adineta ricciae]|uniref:Uncharacterized protein n=1 Tax=Adineta ricciae TaxID=249248 RepID=A0A815QJN2_ADIRI|nr:unnamed protein product [Adineta ricciae]CAF1601594.1 unnamed protein product [Adineta ricciae]
MVTTTIEFKIFVPNKKQAELLIARTQDRQSRQRISTVKNDQTVYFHCQVSNLEGGDYEYRDLIYKLVPQITNQTDE